MKAEEEGLTHDPDGNIVTHYLTHMQLVLLDHVRRQRFGVGLGVRRPAPETVSVGHGSDAVHLRSLTCLVQMDWENPKN